MKMCYEFLGCFQRMFRLCLYFNHSVKNSHSIKSTIDAMVKSSRYNTIGYSTLNADESVLMMVFMVHHLIHLLI